MDEKGFTLIELIIVLAIIGIIGAVIMPNFLGITDKARIKSDLQSARAVQNAIELYKADTGKNLESLGKDAEEVIEELIEGLYLQSGAELQTSGATWVMEDGTLKVKFLDFDTETLSKSDGRLVAKE